MIISEVKIANMALALLGVRSTIENFTENTVEANQAQLWYDLSRQQVLEAFDWNFARKRLTLAAHSEDPPDGVWEYRYQYPADCLHFRKINNPSGDAVDAIPFDVESDATGQTKSILTDLEDAIGVYTFDLESPVFFSPLFIDALSTRLAAHIAIALTGKAVIRDGMFKLSEAIIAQAAAHSANEQVASPPRDADHIRGRA